MRLAVSNIAWQPADEESVIAVLRERDVDALEVAPKRLFDDPADATDEQFRAVRETWRQRGIPIVSMQALLFGRPDLLLFGEAAAREQTIAYLDRIFALAAALGCGPLVFGSPANRAIGALPRSHAMELALHTFRRIGDAAQRHGVTFCIEPNARDYKCDFITNTAEGVELVRAIDHPAVRLHLDGGVITLNRENPNEAIGLAAPYLAHFHASEPHLASLGGGGTDHEAIAAALREHGYAGIVAIEMRPAGEGKNVEAVRRALEIARKAYGGAAA